MFVGSKQPVDSALPAGRAESSAGPAESPPNTPLSTTPEDISVGNASSSRGFMDLLGQKQQNRPSLSPSGAAPGVFPADGDLVAAGARAEYVEKIKQLPPLNSVDRKLLSVCVDLSEALAASGIGVGLTGVALSAVRVPGFFWKAAVSVGVGAAAMTYSLRQNEQKCISTSNRLSDPLWRELIFDMAANRLNTVERATLKSRIGVQVRQDRVIGMPHHLPPPHSRSITLEWIQSQPKRYAAESSPSPSPSPAASS